MKKLVSFLLFFISGVFLGQMYAFTDSEILVHDGVALYASDCGYTIDYTLGEYEIIDETIGATDGEYIFSSVAFANDFYDRMEEVGRPALPFFGLDLQIPMLHQGLSVSVVEMQTEEIELPYDFVPALLYAMNEDIQLAMDMPYYNEPNYTWGWEEYTWHTYFIPRHAGLNFVINPFHYEPLTRMLTVVTFARYQIDISGCDLWQEVDNRDAITISYFDNIHPDDKYDYALEPLVTDATYLILAADYFQRSSPRGYRSARDDSAPADDRSSQALRDFVEHKRNIGYNVEVEYFPSHSTSNTIRGFLEYYYSLHPELLYVLIVGTPDLMPFSSGMPEDSDNPPSDLDYVRIPPLNMDEYDFNIPYFLGRWPVQSEDEFRNIVDKTINNELNLGAASPSKVSVFSGSGKHDLAIYHDAEWIYDEVNSVSGLTATLWDGRSSAVTKSSMTGDLGGNSDLAPWMFVYTGHGNTGLIGSPYSWYYHQIDDAPNSQLDFQPFGFAFACLVGNVFSANNFTRNWLHSPNGGVTMFASTTTSYMSPDRYMSRNMFAQLEGKPNTPIGNFVYGGKKKFFDKCKTLPRKREIRKYNLYGDPSLYMLGVNWSTGTPYRAHRQAADTEVPALTQTDDAILITSEMQHVRVFNMQGVCVYESEEPYITTTSFLPGIYVVQVDNGTDIRTEKITIH